MKISIKMEIKAILFGVDDTIIGKLEIGNGYKIERDRLSNSKLWKQFDYTDFGIRRVYEVAKLNDELEIAILKKELQYEYQAIVKEGQGYLIDNKNVIDITNDIEVEEMQYVDEKMRIIRLYCENGFNIKELLINTTVLDEKEELFRLNSKIPFPDNVPDYVQRLQISNNEDADNINSFIKEANLKFPNSIFKSELLTSACFLYDQSYYAPVETLRFMVCVIGLESLLVDGNAELSYRLSRNCAMLLSDNAEEYSELYKKIRKLYEIRSEFVHNGMVKNLECENVVMARDILRKTIFKIIEKNITKEQLLKELDLKGYVCQ